MAALNDLLKRAGELEMVRGVEIGVMTLRLSYHIFADGALIFCQSEEKMLLNLRCILLCFQVVLSLNIYLKKSELVRIVISDEVHPAGMVGCKVVNLLIKFLGIPLGLNIETLEHENL